LLALRRRSDWPLGLVIVALLLAGHVIHYWVVIAESNVSGIERLFEIAAVPLLAAAIYRRAAVLPVSRPTGTVEPAASDVTRPTPAPETQKPSPASFFDPRAAGAFVSLGNAASLPDLQNFITTAVAHSLAAPLTLLLIPETAESGTFSAVNAYDLSQLQHIGRPFALRLPSGLVAGLGQGGSVAWLSGDAEPELHALIVVAELPSPSPIVLTAIQATSGELLALLATVPPAEVSDWALERRSWLASLAEIIARAWESLAAGGAPAVSLETGNQFEAERDAARQEVARLTREGQLQAERLQRLERAEAARADDLAELESLRANLQAVQPEIEASRRRQQQLEADVAQRQAQLDALTPGAAAEQLDGAIEPVVDPIDERENRGGFRFEHLAREGPISHAAAPPTA